MSIITAHFSEIKAGATGKIHAGNKTVTCLDQMNTLSNYPISVSHKVIFFKTPSLIFENVLCISKYEFSFWNLICSSTGESESKIV